MKKTIKKKWVAALRSGEYRRGIGELKTKKGGFCCLGVLCDLHAKETGNEWDGRRYLGRGEYLPFEVEKWAGLDSTNPKITHDHYVELGNLADLNDRRGTKFEEVAAIIEKQL